MMIQWYLIIRILRIKSWIPSNSLLFQAWGKSFRLQQCPNWIQPL